MADLYMKGAFSPVPYSSLSDGPTHPTGCPLGSCRYKHTLPTSGEKSSEIFFIPGHLGSCGLLECGPHMSSPTPVWLLGSSNPVELTSPNFPNAFDASNLECEWVVKPRFGTKVSLVDVKC